MWTQEPWQLTAERVAIHRPTNTAVLADMHLGYVAARRGDGEAVPHFGEVERLDYLSQIIEHLHIKNVVIAGDIVESARHGLPIVREWALQLRERQITLHLVPGNHDQGLREIPELVLHPNGYPLGEWLVLHDAPVDDDRCIIQGHLHPTIRATSVAGEAACFLLSEKRLLLPAWCEHAAGVSVQSLDGWQQTDCFGIVGEEVVALGNVEALGKKLRRRPRPFRIGFGLSK